MKLKVGIKVVCSTVLFFILFLSLQRLVEPKYAKDILEGNFTREYYEEITKHDVIFIGDCEVYENFNPMYLWKNYGITSYIRGNAQQLIWQSYYMLEDTLKYEIPKVVIYNVQALTYDEPQKEEYNRMTLDGMKWSRTKYEAIQASMCEGEKMLDYVFPILRYHQRFLELSKDDFTYFLENKKVSHNGYYMRVDVLPASESEVADTTWLLGEEETEKIQDPWSKMEVKEESQNTESEKDNSENKDKGSIFSKYPMEYLDKIRKLCEENKIQLILIKAPSLAPQWYDSENEQILKYAEKYNLPYINFYELLDETEIDYETDTYDGGLHMNLSGSEKLSKYLGNILVNEYGVKDCRKDRTIAKVYEEKYGFYEDMIEAQNQELLEYGEIKSY